MQETQTILLAMPTRYWLARRAALGIARYAQGHCRWELLIPPLDQPEQIRTPGQMGAAGAIISTGIPRPAEFADCVEPVIVLDSPLLDGIRPRVMTDRHAVGRLAGEYFIARGFYSFGYVTGGWPVGLGWYEGFRECVGQVRGAVVAVYETALGLDRRPFREALTELSTWIAGLPRPCAILACDDHHGAIVIQAARHAGLRVPEEIAVLGVQDEAIFREASQVPLSTIALACERMGYEAASMLHALLQGRAPPADPVLVPPVEVLTRRSTDCRVVSDPEVARAMAWIGDHLHEQFGIEEMIAQLPVSRSTLERRFKAVLGRSPLDEVLRQRVERAKSLLVDSDWDLKRIAEACGFGSVFRKLTGQSPARYRSRFLRRNHNPVGTAWSPSDARR
ncbi:MAG TPA: substrate-binding domain-containing protein [Tepidisphaeraceae bacterium]|nr:substrate-binding domain-containing protein [Tepidisphaeraceae bacterium]